MSEEATVRKIEPEAQLFTADDLLELELPRERFVVPGYGKAVEIHALNALEQSRYQASIYEMRTDAKGKVHGVGKMEGANIRLVTLGMDTPKLSEAQIGKLPNEFVSKVADRIRDLSGMNLTVEEAEGN